MYYRFIQIAFFLVVLFIFSLNKANAAVIFEDNFDSYSDGAFPTKWQPINHPATTLCDAPWTVVNGEVGVKIVNQGSCATNIMPNNSSWPTLVNNYIFEAKIRIVSGTDHNLAYRIVPSNTAIYEIHFQSPGDFNLSIPSGSIVHINKDQNYPFGSYNLKIVVDGVSVKVYIDEELVRDVTLSSQLPVGKIALRAGTGGDPSSETWFDDVRITTLDLEDQLGVPDLKQTDPLWGGTIYDSANLWAGNNNNIARWGCAITSAAMVFQYHGVEKMPDNTNLDPGALNKWLKSQIDGYTRSGHVNWLALSRLSLLAKSKNTYEDFDALEFSRYGASKTQLSSDLENKLPIILQQPGHFVVAKGEEISENTFLINDPYYDYDSLLNYGNTFLSARRFTPSKTDLSYLMFVVDENIDLKLKNSNGDEVGESFVDEPIINPLGDSNGPLPLKILYLQKPENGDYVLELSSSQSSNYLLDGYLYDKNGNAKKISVAGIVSNGAVDTFKIKQNKDNLNLVGLNQVVTFDSIKNDLDFLYKTGKIKSFTAYVLWSTELDQAKFFSNISKKGAKTILNTLKKQISGEKRVIDSVSKELLVNQINVLIGSIK